MKGWFGKTWQCAQSCNECTITCALTHDHDDMGGMRGNCEPSDTESFVNDNKLSIIRNFRCRLHVEKRPSVHL